jgi:TRAP-type C4-dicarboxylate transport system substrate-binding protein
MPLHARSRREPNNAWPVSHEPKDKKKNHTAFAGEQTPVIRGNAMISKTSAFGVAAILAVSASAPTAQAQTKIVFNSFAPPTFVINQGMIDAWAKRVEKVTEGRVVVEIPATSLAPPQQQWEMVTQGVADGTYIFNAFAQKRLLLPQVAHLPFVSPNATAQGIALWRTHKKFFEAANEYEGVIFLGYFSAPGGHLWSMEKDKPIVTANDLKNVKTWSLPGDQARALERIGAVVVSGPAVRSYEIISKGIVNAYGSHSYDSAYSFNVTQYATSVTEIPGGMGAASFSVFMNKDKWASIPKRDQDLILSISGEELAKYGKVWDDREAAARERLKQEGKVKMNRASDALMGDLRKAWSFLDDEWVANAGSRKIDGKAALKYFVDQMKELAR